MAHPTNTTITNMRGAYTALITPMKPDGSIDQTALAKFAEHQANMGITGLVPAGTTGESPTLDHNEHKLVIDVVCEAVGERVAVMPGTGSNSTEEAIRLSQHAMKVKNVAGLMLVSPYYNRPDQRGLLTHFTAVAKACRDLPIIVYDIPSRSAVSVDNKTLAHLHKECPNVVGVKDATQDLARIGQLRRLIGENFIQLSGVDQTLAAYLAEGGHGVISVMSNVAPRTVSRMVAAWHAKDIDTFTTLRDRLSLLAESCFWSPSPAPVKFYLKHRGICDSVFVRSPILPVDSSTAERLADVARTIEDID